MATTPPPPEAAAPAPRIACPGAGDWAEADWRSAAGLPPPHRVVPADDALGADAAYRLACEGTALLWLGDYHNARQLLQAMARRFEASAQKGKRGRRAGAAAAAPSPADAFNAYRMRQAQRARTLGMLLVPLDAGHRLALRRAPEVSEACAEVHGAATRPYALSLRELLGLIGAHEWRRNGVEVPALGARIHPHHGVFSPVRGEYVDLVARAPLPEALAEHGVALDLGTGTGVLAALLARRGARRVLASDCDGRALACARENVDRLGLAGQVELVCADLFPDARVALAVCNPPWLPGRPGSPLEAAIYDPGRRMLRGFLDGLAGHLIDGGEGWLILSDLAVRLGLEAPDLLPGLIDAAGLAVAGRLETRPTHGRSADRDDPFHAARSAEITALWRLHRK